MDGSSLSGPTVTWSNRLQLPPAILTLHLGTHPRHDATNFVGSATDQIIEELLIEISLSDPKGPWLCYHIRRAFAALIILSIVGINALYVRHIWVIVTSCIVPLAVRIALLSFLQARVEESSAEHSTATENAGYVFSVVSGLVYAGIILGLTTFYVTEHGITVALWVLSAMGLALGGFLGWRKVNVPYVEHEKIERHWWLVVERSLIGNDEPVAEE
jgi:hypothetical protein